MGMHATRVHPTGLLCTGTDNRNGKRHTAREAAMLFGATIIVSTINRFFGIFSLFVNTDLPTRITTPLLVGVVGIAIFYRYPVFYLSDRARMSWMQEHSAFVTNR